MKTAVFPLILVLFLLVIGPIGVCLDKVPRYTEEDIEITVTRVPEDPSPGQEILFYVTTKIAIQRADIDIIVREIHLRFDYPTGGTIENVSHLTELISGDDINGTYRYQLQGQEEGVRITYFIAVVVYLKGGDTIRKRSDMETFTIKAESTLILLIENWWWLILAIEIGFFGTMVVLFLKATKEEIRY